MSLARPALAFPPRRFGRGPLRALSEAAPVAAAAKISDDVKLFATTFAAGFVVVSILIG